MIITRSQCRTLHTQLCFSPIFYDYTENIALYFLNRFYVTTWERVFDRCHGNCRRHDFPCLPRPFWPHATLPHLRFIKDGTPRIFHSSCLVSGMFCFLFWEDGSRRKHRMSENISAINTTEKKRDPTGETCSSTLRERCDWNQVEYYWNTAETTQWNPALLRFGSEGLVKEHNWSQTDAVRT